MTIKIDEYDIEDKNKKMEKIIKNDRIKRYENISIYIYF